MRFRSSNFFDRPITETENFAALPSLGGFVEGWTLVVPKAPMLNLQSVPLNLRDEFRGLVHRVRSAVEREYGAISMFEHGPVEAGSLMGCGTDQAHLHIVPFVFETAPAVRGAQWSDCVDGLPFDAPGASRNYLWLQSGGRTQICEPELVISQFFRQEISASIGQPSGWDYKSQPHNDNVARTAQRLRNAMDA